MCPDLEDTVSPGTPCTGFVSLYRTAVHSHDTEHCWGRNLCDPPALYKCLRTGFSPRMQEAGHAAVECVRWGVHVLTCGSFCYPWRGARLGEAHQMMNAEMTNSDA